MTNWREWAILAAAGFVAWAWVYVCKLAQRIENERAHYEEMTERGVLR
jgi:hypothetical protein